MTSMIERIESTPEGAARMRQARIELAARAADERHLMWRQVEPGAWLCVGCGYIARHPAADVRADLRSEHRVSHVVAAVREASA